MNYEAFLQAQSDSQLSQLMQTGGVPPEFIQQELARRAKLRTATEGADMSPEYSMGLGAMNNG